MDGISGLYVVLFVVSLGLAAFFCSAETAFIGMQKLRLQHLIHTNQPRARIVARILAQPEKFLATVLLGINLFETTSATLGTLIAVSLWGESWGAAMAIILVTLLTLILAELIPKSLATRYGERMALSYARPIEFVATILYPLVYVLHHIGLRFTRLVSEGSELKPTMSQEEFRTAIRVGEAEGTMKEAEAEMLHNVFDFGHRPVREVMVPRPEVVFIEQGSTVADFLAIYVQSPLSRFPVYRENRDNVVGILEIKDVLMALAKGTMNN
ncbi:MAG: CNNM domain-containing protein, partial [Dehalococcoidales bacterium]|nr:CNNM domain-containing protein [Dehalococcoidales bacterium]